MDINIRRYEKTAYFLIVILNIFLAYFSAKPSLGLDKAIAILIFLMAAYFICQVFPEKLWKFEKNYWPEYLRIKLEKHPGLPVRIFGWVVISIVTIIQIL